MTALLYVDFIIDPWFKLWNCCLIELGCQVSPPYSSLPSNKGKVSNDALDCPEN
jgi:hypothetical protein